MTKPEYFRSPSELLEELGITRPADIDIEAIAFHCGAVIKYRPLTGCTARIIGNGHQAIITIDSNSLRGRQRFSAGHEIGHWMHDRGKASFSCEERQFVQEWSKNNPESRANQFASDLLLPLGIFKPLAEKLRAIDLTAAGDLARQFQMSLTATAIRLVEHGPLPAMLICYSSSGQEWFVRNRNLSKQLWPVLFRFSWKWRVRSPTKIMERTHEEATEALYAGRESRHPEAASVGAGSDLRIM
jgi:hypothetical protein